MPRRKFVWVICLYKGKEKGKEVEKMGLPKGRASKAFEEGKLEKYNFKNLPKEKRQEISRKGHEARRENSRRKKEMKEQLEIILGLDVKSKKSKKILDEMGIGKEDSTNQMLMLVALFQKAISGDVAAFKEIRDMIEGTQGEEQGNKNMVPVINIIGVNDKNVKVENKMEEWEDEDDDWE